MRNSGFRPPKLTRIEDPIADDFLYFRGGARGKWNMTRITVGSPKHWPPARAWYCPVMIEARMAEIAPVYGAGPLDALMNAMGVVRKFFDDYRWISPGAKPKGSKPKSPRGPRNNDNPGEMKRAP